MKTHSKDYHKQVVDYYDTDADLGFELRAEENPLLSRIRSDFRRITVKYPFSIALEIGCGPGFDLYWFASQYPEREFVGVDISPKMISLTQKRISSTPYKNARALVSNENDLTTHFKAETFDMIYVYFGALNTVKDLDFASDQIHVLLKDKGFAILTFVNKWYMREMIVQSLKQNFGPAFSRLRKEWGGYSIERHLPSRCYSPGRILKTFHKFELIEKKGYSILFPAWYNFKKYYNKQDKLNRLWDLDQRLQNSIMWSKGEYTLFVLQKV